MLYKKIKLDESDSNVFLEIYVADSVGDYQRDGLLVIPGGGYAAVCSDREGEPIAMAFMPHGFNCFVLHYSVGKKAFPCQLIEASKAMKHIKDNAAQYGINPDRIFTVGFSAGGHLAACLGTMWNKKEIYEAIDMPMGYNKPKGMMLIYPVISAKYEDESFENLWMKKEMTEEELFAVSVENFVDRNSSPAFIMHTANDTLACVQHSMTLAEKFVSIGVPFEMHIYPDAPHGIALGNIITACGVKGWCNEAIAKWIDHASFWAKQLQ